MRKALIAMVGLMAVGAVQAATVAWAWNSASEDWDVANSSFYMVHATEQLTGAEAIYAASSNYGADGAFGTGWGLWENEKPDSVPGTTTVESMVGTNDMMFWGEVTFTFQDALERPDIDLTSGYLYLVVFNATDPANATQVGVGYVELSDDNPAGGGIVGPGGSGGIIPHTPTWIAGTYVAVMPEPTALALLALGVTGDALRRRVR